MESEPHGATSAPIARTTKRSPGCDEISNRGPADGAEYPDDDLMYTKAPDGAAIFSRKDGSSC
jgi:hypothetical protein